MIDFATQATAQVIVGIVALVVARGLQRSASCRCDRVRSPGGPPTFPRAAFRPRREHTWPSNAPHTSRTNRL